MKSLKNSTGGEQCSRLVFSSLEPALEEFGTTEILLQSQLYPLNQRVEPTQDRHHCAPSLDLDHRFDPILQTTSLSSSTSPSSSSNVPRPISLSSSGDGFVRQKIKGCFKKIYLPIKNRSCKLKMKPEDVWKKTLLCSKLD